VKCIKCNCDSKLKERENGCCIGCKHPFVFDPRKRPAGDFFNDKLFEKSIALISVNNTLKFTPKQYHYFVNGMKAVNSPGAASQGFAVLLFIVAIVVCMFGAGAQNVFLMVAGPIVLVLLGMAMLPSVQASFGVVPKKTIKVGIAGAFERWAAVNEPIKSLLPSPEKSLPRGDVAAELLDYSFDRLVVTESDDIAQFLLANNFHFENNCAVLSINKYPITLFTTIMRMLRNNPDLKVYALHSCSWRGIKILDQLRNGEDWFKDQPGVQIIDLGLLPRQLAKRPAFVEQNSAANTPNVVPMNLKESLTDTELKWLDKGNIVQLESIPPQGLLRLISMGIAMSKDPTKKDSLVPVSNTSGSGTDGGIYVFTSDSFG